MSNPRVIRKYPNRRLYDTQSGSFINTEELRRLVVNGDEFTVLDKQSGDDITRSVLLQILVDAEESGEPLLSATVLRHMIRFYGNVMQSAFGRYLETATEQFLNQQEGMERQLRELMSGGPMAAMNELFRRQMEQFYPFGADGKGGDKKD